MRMVYTSARKEAFYPARGRLALRFERWALHNDRPADLTIVEALLSQRWAAGDGLLGRWQPEDLERALLDWFPRKVTLAPEKWDEVLPVVRAFLDFLVDQRLADPRCATPQQLHVALDKLGKPFAEAMADETRYGLAKFWAMRMLRDGIDPADPVAAQRFMVDLRAGRLDVDEELLDQVMANHLLDMAERNPSLPLVAVPDDDSLRALAEDSPVVRQLREVVRWVGEGRLLTATGGVRRADARELVALLETGDVIDPVIGDRVLTNRDSEEPYGLRVLVAWARAARVVRVARGRLVPVANASKVLADPLALATRAFTALFEIGEVVCRSGPVESALWWRFDDALLNVVTALYITPEPLPLTAVRELAYQATSDAQPDPADGERERRRLADRDVVRLLDQLRRLGAIERRTPITLTALGIGLVAAHLRATGVPVPTVRGLLGETAEVVVATAAEAAPENAAELLAAWCASNPDTARAALRALAARTDDPDHRRLARMYSRWRPARRPHRSP